MKSDAVLLFDGECGLCHRLVRFIAARDHRRRISFAPLGGDYARELLAGFGVDSSAVDEALLVTGTGTQQRKLYRGPYAALTALRLAAPGWRWLAAVLTALPKPLLTQGYRFVAKRRYRWFKRADACALDPALLAGKVID